MRTAGTKNRSGQARLKCIVLGAANAGKTSILRRYFLGTFQHGRIPTVGADFYTARVRIPAHVSDEEEDVDDEKKIVDTKDHHRQNNDVFISLQMWDTAGRKRFVAKERAKYSAALSDAFFRQANAAMLVYDATSSTSFTQLLQWHSDLMEKMKHLDKGPSSARRKNPFPVLIVANKMDLLKRNIAKPERRKEAPQRDVIGLGGKFKGMDSRYEYRAARVTSDTAKPRYKRREEISTYMVTGNTWTTDGSYLDSVLTTEDSSHPDRDMVLLWCMRNGLKHVEVSARDGSGIDEAMETLVVLAMESLAQAEEYQRDDTSKASTVPPKTGYHEWSNEQLDLHRRYAPKEEQCQFLRPFAFCKK